MRYHKPRLVITPSRAVMTSYKTDIVKTKSICNIVRTDKGNLGHTLSYDVDVERLKITYQNRTELPMIVNMDHTNPTLVPPIEFEVVSSANPNSGWVKLTEISLGFCKQYKASPSDDERKDQPLSQEDTLKEDPLDLFLPNKTGSFLLTKDDLHWLNSSSISFDESATRYVTIEDYNGNRLVCRDGKEKNKVYFALGNPQKGNFNSYYCRLSDAEEFFQFLLDHLMNDGDTVNIGLNCSEVPSLVASQSIDHGGIIDSCALLLVRK